MATERRVPPATLREAVSRLLEAAGVPTHDARVAARVFVLQEMRGVTTHGLRRLPQTLDDLREGRLNAKAQRRVISEASSMVVLDGDGGLGMPGCVEAMDRAVTMAQQGGTCIAVLRNSGHFLGAAPYCLRAADQGCIGIAFSNAAASMAYPGTTEAALGNGPFGYAVPTAAGFPLVYDGAMTISGGRLLQWAASGVPEDVDFLGLDSEGRPTRDPNAVLQGGATFPIGGHKGAALVLLTEVLTGLLGGGGYLHRAGSAESLTTPSQCCIAVDVTHFMALEDFRSRTTALVREIKGRHAEDGREALLPGERAQSSVDDCEAHGVPLGQDMLADLRRQAAELNVEFDL